MCPTSFFFSKDDLVVGSPFYGEKERQRDRSGGAIYVYMNEGEVGINRFADHIDISKF